LEADSFSTWEPREGKEPERTEEGGYGVRTRIDCCNGCVPPKRTADCHSYCPEYTGQRAELDESNKEINLKHLTASNIYGQRSDSVARVTRKRRV
jgi:hypothetical protein